MTPREDLEKLIENRLEELVFQYVDEIMEDYRLIDKRIEDDDLRLIYEVKLLDRFIIIKLAKNSFTNSQKILDLVELYNDLDIYCPKFIKAKNGAYSLKLMDSNGTYFDVWCENFKKHITIDEFIDKSEDKPYWKNYFDDSSFRKELGYHLGKIASYTSVSEILSPTPYILFDKFCESDVSDEYTEFVTEVYHKLKDDININQKNLMFAWEQFHYLREKVKRVYHLLPTAVFQGDLNETNVMIDENNHLIGLIDFNISGREVVLNYLINEGVYQEEKEVGSLWMENSYNAKSDFKFKNVIDAFKCHYTFNELEIEEFSNLYKVIRPYKFLFLIGILRNYKNENYEEVNYRLKWMRRELEREDLNELIKNRV